MSTSHFTSNVEGNVKVAVASLEATDIKARTQFSAPEVYGTTKVKVGNYIQFGTHQYMIFGNANSETVVAAEATAIDASCRGSLYLSRPTTTASPSELYIMRTDTLASTVQAIGA